MGEPYLLVDIALLMSTSSAWSSSR